MGLFNFTRKPSLPGQSSSGPYKDSSTNLIYNLLFCDNLQLYKAHTKEPFSYPFDILFSEKSSVAGLERIVADNHADPRARILGSNKLLALGHKPKDKELFAVIVEVGLDGGLDVLASFNNGTARYINQTGKIIIWETSDKKSLDLTNQLFSQSTEIVGKLGPWNKARRPGPSKGNARITFLVSDGLYFGEAPMDVLFNDRMAGPALNTAAELMKYYLTSCPG